MKKLLIVDDEINVTRSLTRALRNEHYEVLTCNDPLDALAIAAATELDVILSDQRMPGMSGPELLSELRERQPECVRLAMSAHQDFNSMIDLFNSGLIQHFLPKPWCNNHLRELLGSYLGSREQSSEQFNGIVTRNTAMLELFSKISRLTDPSVPVFIFGETGTGKELVARAIHNQSGRKGRFVAINCSNFSNELFESQLFGHKKGAFTGAVSDQEGLLAAADGGTLFLDEITDLTPASQNKLLRTLQERVFTPLGSTRETSFNCRVISASSTMLHDAVQAGSFRADLMYRLEVIPLSLPPLRERKEDIPLLFSHFTGQQEISESLMSALTNYDWPGNVRELQNAAQHAAAFTDSGSISAEHLPERIASNIREREVADSTFSNGQKLTPHLIATALERHGNNRSAAARELGISRMTLYRHLKQSGLPDLAY